MIKKAKITAGRKRNALFSVTRCVLAVGISLLVACTLIFVTTKGSIAVKFSETLTALKAMLINPILTNSGKLNIKGLTDVLSLMIPIMFTGLATCVMFSANQFNLGSEGGIMLGAFVTALVAIYVPLPGITLPIVAIIAGGISVALCLFIPAILKAKFGASEMVNSLMMNYIIQYFINYLLNARGLADRSKGQIQTFPFRENALLPQIIDNGSKFHIGFIIALVCVVIVGLFMYRTKWGYSMRMIGINEDFSKYSGINVVFTLVLAQVVGGLLAGIGGGVEMLGRYTFYDWKTLPGYGWNGVTVAILAGNNPWLVPISSLFLAYLNRGCTYMSTFTNVPAQLISIIQACVFLFFAAKKFLAGYKQKLVVKTAKEEMDIKQHTEELFRGGDK